MAFTETEVFEWFHTVISTFSIVFCDVKVHFLHSKALITLQAQGTIVLGVTAFVEYFVKYLWSYL